MNTPTSTFQSVTVWRSNDFEVEVRSFHGNDDSAIEKESE